MPPFCTDSMLRRVVIAVRQRVFLRPLFEHSCSRYRALVIRVVVAVRQRVFLRQHFEHSCSRYIVGGGIDILRSILIVSSYFVVLIEIYHTL